MKFPRTILRVLLSSALVSSAAAGPTVSVTSPSAGATVSSLTSVSITFSETVTGVDSADLQVNGENAAAVTGTGAGPYVFTFTQPAPGTVSLLWEPDHGIAGITGTGTEAFVAPGSWSYTLTDTVAPAVGKIATTVAGQEMDAVFPSPGSTVASLTQATVTFSESVSGVDAADMAINGGAASGVTGEGAGPYVFTFAPPGNGAVTFLWAGSTGIVDTAGNAFAGGSWSVTKAASAGTLVVTEFLALNAGVAVQAGSDTDGTRDEDFDVSPWIEILNTGASAVNLAGWSLTNEYEPPDGVMPARWSNAGQWVFRSGSLAPGARLVVWASGKDRKPAAGHLHTNFGLDTNGGSLALFAPNSPRTAPASSFNQYPAQRYDFSYGLQSTDSAVRYFSPPTVTQTAYTLPSSATPAPTPPAVPLGTVNNTSVLTGVTPNPTASVGRGFFNEPFSVILSSSAGGTIRYTLNGSNPSAASTLYSAPLTVNATTLLRFAAFGTNMVPSETVTHSYLFLDSVTGQASPPYNNPAVGTDETNPLTPRVGGQALPVAWGTNSTFTAAQTLPGANNLTAAQVPADYGIDSKIFDDPNRYNDAGAVNAAGKTNLERIQQGLRELPMLSLVMKIEDMFGDGDQGLATSGGLYPNSTASNKTDRTRPCSLELLNTDGTTGFALNCGVDLHGNASRDPFKNPKHGFTLRFKGRYGAGKLTASLFPDTPVHEWDKLVLRADFNSSWRHQNGTNGIASGSDNYQRPRDIRCRDAWAKDAFRDMGHTAGHHRYTNLFINGLYWGTYDLNEDQGEDFAAAYFGGNKIDYDVIDQGVLKSGNWTAYSSMKLLLGWTGGTTTTDRTTVPTAATYSIAFTNAEYEQLKQYLDVPWFIDYMALHWFTGHRDWATTTDYNKNWYAVRHKNGKFKFLPWDQENLLWHESEDRVTGMTNYAAGGTPTLYPPAAIHPRIKSNAEYRLDCADRIHRLCVAPGGALTPAVNSARLDKWAAIVNANAMCLESARWGDYRYKVHAYTLGTVTETYSWNGTWFEGGTSRYNAGVTSGTLGTYNSGMTNNWRAEINRLKTIYFPARTTNLLAQLRTNLLYPALNAPEFRNNTGNALTGDQNVAAGYQLKMQLPSPAPAGTTSAGTIWFTRDGNDPRVAYSTGGQRTPAAEAYSSPFAINTTMTVKARALNGSVWSALMEAKFTVGNPLPPVVISEINYNPRSNQGGTSSEFIEIQNAGATGANLSGWYMEGVDFVFPNGLILGAGDRLVIVSNNAPAGFTAQYPGVIVAGYFGGALDNGGERLSLNDADGHRVFSVEYSDSSPWPLAADNGGYSLELISPAGDPQSAANWKSSNGLKGTPGAVNSAPVNGIIISEFFAAGGAGYVSNPAFTPIPDFVELYNPTPASVNLTDWSIQGAAFPNGTTLAPGARMEIQAGPGATSSTRITASLNRQWGELMLRNASGVVVDGVRYGPQVTSRSFFRNGAGWTLGRPTPGLPDVAETEFSADVKFNEIMANPVSGEDDWLEIYNRDSDGFAVLNGYTIERNGEIFRITAPMVIADDDLVRLYCDPGGQRGDNLNFALPAEGATLTLRNAAWQMADTLTYGAQQNGISQGRVPDATGALTPLAYPSPGLFNTPLPAVRPLFNEVLVINRDGENAPWARRPAWIELKNPTAAAVTVRGWELRTKSGVPQSWKFPDGVTIPAGGLLSVWCDPQQPVSTAPSSHLNSGLPLNGTYASWGVELLTDDGLIYDQITWGDQIPDLSMGRLANNSWALLAAPTRGTPNAAAAVLAPATGVKINEWFANTPSLPQLNSFIELYNPAAAPAAPGGLWLGDEPSETGRRKWQVPALTFIGGQSHALFTSGEGTSQPAQFHFDLAGGGEQVRLSQNDASATVVDLISYGLPAQDTQSQGRLPDGTATTGSLTPTPGAPNSSSPGPVIILQPGSTAVPAGQSVSLFAQALGYTTLQWLRNGQPVPGGTMPYLIFPGVTAADEADYSFSATNNAGTSVSRPAHLTVLYTYAAFASEHGLGGQNADADNDGTTNGDEFLAGTNPLTATPLSSGVAGGSETIAGTNYLTLEYTVSRRAAFAGLTGQRSSDLSLWNDAAPAITEPVSNQHNGDYRVKVKFPWLPGDDRAFVRLRVVP